MSKDLILMSLIVLLGLVKLMGEIDVSLMEMKGRLIDGLPVSWCNNLAQVAETRFLLSRVVDGVLIR